MNVAENNHLDEECALFQEEIFAYIDGELSFERQKELDEHLKVCDACRFFLDENIGFEKELKSLADNMPASASADIAWQRFRARIEEDGIDIEMEKPVAAAKVVRLPFRHLRENVFNYSLLAVAAALLVFVNLHDESFDLSPSHNIVTSAINSDVVPTNTEQTNPEVAFDMAQTTQAIVNTVHADWENDLAADNYFRQMKESDVLATNVAQASFRGTKNVAVAELGDLPEFDGRELGLSELTEMVDVAAGYVFDGRQRVNVASFRMDKFPVSNGEYAKFIAATTRTVPFNWENNNHASFDKSGLKPVTYVSWDDASAFCQWEGKRLPSNQEWMRAARGDSQQLYPWGDDFSRKMSNTRESGLGLRNIGSYATNVSPSGVMEMSSNIREWVQDDYQDKNSFPGLKNLKIMKGASFTDTADKALVDSFSYGERDTIYGNTGIRCASSL